MREIKEWLIKISLFAFFLILSVVAIGSLLEYSINYYEKNVNIKSCEFVCSHLEKIIEKDRVKYIIQHPVFDYLKNRTPGLGYAELEGMGKMGIPIRMDTNEPYYCPCKFKIVYCPELGGKLPHIFDRCKVREDIIILNYTSWKEWWLRE